MSTRDLPFPFLSFLLKGCLPSRQSISPSVQLPRRKLPMVREEEEEEPANPSPSAG
jgi:hypothetical protein